jgi:hypothetical protein
MQMEHMAPEIIQTRRESSFRGSMQNQSKPDLREICLAQRESCSFRGSFLRFIWGREVVTRCTIS